MGTQSMRELDASDNHRGRSTGAGNNWTLGFRTPELAQTEKNPAPPDDMAAVVTAATGAGAPPSGPSTSDINGWY